MTLKKSRRRLLPDGRAVPVDALYVAELAAIDASPPAEQLPAFLQLLSQQEQIRDHAALEIALIHACKYFPTSLFVSDLCNNAKAHQNYKKIINKNLNEIIDELFMFPGCLRNFAVLAIGRRNVMAFRRILTSISRYSDSAQAARAAQLELAAITPHRAGAAAPMSDGALDRRSARTLICDPGTPHDFIADVISQTGATRLHFYGDLNGSTKLAIPEKGAAAVEIIGARHVVGRYDADYIHTFDKCRRIGQVVAQSTMELIRQIKLAETAEIETALALLVDERLFYTILCIDAVKHLIDSADHEVIFMVGKTEFLWDIARALHAEPRGDKILVCAPAWTQAERLNNAKALAHLKETISAPLSERPAGPDPAAEIGQLRYFASAIKTGAAIWAGQRDWAKTNKNLDILFAGANYVAYLEAGVFLFAEASRHADLNSAYINIGGPSQAARNVISRLTSKDAALNKKLLARIYDVDYNIHGSRSAELFGSWLWVAIRDKMVGRQDLVDDSSASLAVRLRLETLVRVQIPTQIICYLIYKALLTNMNVKVVAVCPQRSPEIFMLLAAARAVGVATYALDVHILDNKYPRNTCVMADRVAVINEYFKQQYIANFDALESQIDVVGSLRLEMMLRDRAGARLARNELLRRHKLSSGDAPILMFASQPLKWRIVEPIFRRFCRSLAIAQFKGQVAVKLHREETADRYARYLEIAGAADQDRLFAFVEGEITDLIDLSDAVVTYYSTTGLEAHSMGVPVMTVLPEEGRFPTDWAEQGLATGARTEEEMAAFIAAIRRQERPPPRIETNPPSQALIEILRMPIARRPADGARRRLYVNYQFDPSVLA